MILTIPTWLIVTAVALAPFVVLVVTTFIYDSGGYMDFSPLIGLAITLVVAASCWTGLFMWWWLR